MVLVLRGRLLDLAEHVVVYRRERVRCGVLVDGTSLAPRVGELELVRVAQVASDFGEFLEAGERDREAALRVLQGLVLPSNRAVAFEAMVEHGAFERR